MEILEFLFLKLIWNYLCDKDYKKNRKDKHMNPVMYQYDTFSPLLFNYKVYYTAKGSSGISVYLY